MSANSFIDTARAAATEWALNLIQAPESWVILDTETTGFRSTDQVIQIGVLSGAGEALIDNQLIRPTCDMDPEAQAVHGISLEMLQDAPLFVEFSDRLDEVLKDKRVIIYNAAYDTRMLMQSLAVSDNLRSDWRLAFRFECAMEQYARYYGEWNQRRGSFRWQKLPHLADQPAHNALADCRSVLGLIRRMAGME